MTLPSPSPVDRADIRIGTTIREKYRIERVLGVGGMATVYLATHRNGNRAALKILHPELGNGLSGRRALQIPLRMMGRYASSTTMWPRTIARFS